MVSFKEFLSGTFVLSMVTGFAQIDVPDAGRKSAIEATYNWGLIGGNISLNYIRAFKYGDALVAGIKWHNTGVVKDNGYYAFRHRGYAANTAEALGINLGYQRTFAPSQNVEPFFFALSQLSLIRFRFIAYNPQGLENYQLTGPYYVAETNVGVGLQIRLVRDLWLTQAAGGGIWLGKPRGDGFHFYSDDVEWSFSGLIRLGLQYRL